VLQELRAILVADTRAAEQFPRERAGDVDGAVRHRAVEHVHLEAPRLHPVAHPHLRGARTAGGEREQEAGVALAADHAVVEHVTPLVEVDDVAAAADLDVVHVVRVQPLQRLDHVGATDHHLAERAHVAERHALADRPVLGDRVAVVPRAEPAAEAIEVGAELLVLVMQRSTTERVDVVAGRGLGQ
jgi:hypothetical protein